MQIHELKPKTKRQKTKRVGRGGKRGTFSGKGTKGQKSRAGAGVRPGFRGGVKPLWQQYPKQRGASSKPGNKKVHRKHRFNRPRVLHVFPLNVGQLNVFLAGTTVTLELLKEQGLVTATTRRVKILADGILDRALTLQGLPVSKAAVEKITKAGGTVNA